MSKLTTEAKRIEEAAKWSAQGQFEQAKIWRGSNMALGVPASGLAAIAGATGLATAAGRVWAALLALASSAFGAVMTSLNLARRIEQAQTAANAYLALQQDARVYYEVELEDYTYDDARSALRELIARQQEINKSAPIPSAKAYKKAGKNIEGGGQTYEADKDQ